MLIRHEGYNMINEQVSYDPSSCNCREHLSNVHLRFRSAVTRRVVLVASSEKPPSPITRRRSRSACVSRDLSSKYQRSLIWDCSNFSINGILKKSFVKSGTIP